MDKRKLKLLKIEQLPTAIEVSQISDSQKLKYAFVAKKHSEGKEQILEVTFLSLETKIADFRVFFNKKEFITEKLHPERKWSESSLENLILRYTEAAIPANESTSKIICTFFDNQDKPYQVMVDFQQDLKKRRLAVRHKQETDKIDEHMKIVPGLPLNFTAWINEVALNKSRYIYYKKINSSTIEAFCTSCLKPVIYRITKKEQHKDVRHNQPGKCPFCGKIIIYKAVGKTTLQVDHVSAAIMQKTEKGFVIRYFLVIKEYKEHYKKPTLRIHEQIRDFYEDGKVIGYEYDNFKQTRKIRWCFKKGNFNLYIACLYTRNLKYVLANTEWKYSCIYELAKNIEQFNICGYLEAYKYYPVYEYLIKLKLYNLVAKNIGIGGYSSHGNLNLKGKGIQAVLGIDKQMLKQLQRINGTINHLELIKKAEKIGVHLKDEEINWVVQAGISVSIFAKLLKYITAHKAIKYIMLQMKQTPKNTAETYHPFINPLNNMAGDWNDYLKNCDLLGYDMKDSMILFPNDLKARHDEIMERMKPHKHEVFNKAIADMSATLEKEYGFKNKNFTIHVPRSADEIIAEGHALHHCVGAGSYIKEMAQGNSIILFVRKVVEPDKPFYTIEIEEHRVLQCRGENNCSMTDEVKKFISEWQKKKLKQKTSDSNS